jgi:anti-sigma factor RsiW
MEADRKPDEILLNAMVDGELAPAEHAAAAARLAGDREFARAYATLTRLKAGIAEIAEDRELNIRLAPPASRRHIAAVGIPAALAAAVAIIAFMPMFVSEPEAPPVVVVPAKEVIAVAFAVDPVIPDLSPAGLQLARTVVSTNPGAQALVATYIGPRGCRLELWVSNASASAKSANGTDRRSWRVGGLAYELVAYGMPSARFEKVAEAAEKATRATVLPEDVDQRLIEARVSTAPCVT